MDFASKTESRASDGCRRGLAKTFSSARRHTAGRRRQTDADDRGAITAAAKIRRRAGDL
jgi:hypothetical protein